MLDGVTTVKHYETHPREVENCFGCKITSISFGSVPGGTRPGSFRKKQERDFDKGMHAYREARRAGEQPEATTVEGVRKARQKQEVVERAMKKVEIVNVSE